MLIQVDCLSFVNVNAAGNIERVIKEISEERSVVQRQSLRKRLRDLCSDLIMNDFASLINLLYRVDVSEKKLKDLLQQNPQVDAADLIAGLLIERQLEKAKARQQNKKDNDIPEEDRW